MARLLYSVTIIDATGFEVTTSEGIAAMGAFEVGSERVLKESMNTARKALREAAPLRTKALQRSLRVSKIRRRRHELGRVVVGFQIASGRTQSFYHSITDRRKNTIVSNWWTDVLEELQKAPQFKAWQDEVVRLFVDVIRAEFRERTRTSWRTNFIGGFPGAKVIFSGPSGSLIRAELVAGR